jgi:LysR family carnitine catabolism transcriptional activator
MAVNVGPEELETFLAVAELQSFGRAAERLRLSQPAVTSRVQRLERVMGVALLSRTTRRVSLTDAGERLRQQAQQMMDELQSLRQEFRDEVVLKRGRIAIGAAPTVAATILPPILARFMQRWPGVSIDLHDDFVGPTVERVSKGEVDLGLVPYEGDSRIFDFRPLLRDDFYILVPRDHPLAQRAEAHFREIGAYPLLSMPKEAAVWQTVARAFDAERMTFNPAFQARSLFTLLGLVEAGVGLTLVPRIILPRVNLNAVATVRIAGGSLYRTIGILTLHGRTPSPAANAFIRAVCAALPPIEAAPEPNNAAGLAAPRLRPTERRRRIDQSGE